MRTIDVRGKKVKVPSTWDDWQLCDCPTATNAAIALNEQVDALVSQWTTACHDGEMAPTHAGIISARRRLFDPVLKMYGEAGAGDTEPRGCIVDTIDRIVHAFKVV